MHVKDIHIVIKKFVFFVLKYASPLFLILVPLLAIYGLLNPWPQSEVALSKHPDSIVLLSGFQSNYSGSYEKHSKTYLVIKTNPISSYTVKITTDTQGLHEVNQHEGGLLIILFTYTLLIAITWWFWFKRKTLNNSSDLPVQKTPLS